MGHIVDGPQASRYYTLCNLWLFGEASGEVFWIQVEHASTVNMVNTICEILHRLTVLFTIFVLNFGVVSDWVRPYVTIKH